MKRLKRDRRGVSNIIVVVLGLVIVIAIVSNVILWSYEMNQLDWEKLKEDITILDVSSVIAESWTYNPLEYVLGGATSWISGGISDLTADDDFYLTFRSYYSGTDTTDFVDLNTSDVDSSADKGTHSDFFEEQVGPDSMYDTLTEENTGGAGGDWGITSSTFTSTASHSNYRYMGGVSPNVDNMKVTKLHIRYSGPGTVAIALYTGGTLTDPTGATKRTEAYNVIVSAGWNEIDVPDYDWEKDVVTWVGWCHGGGNVYYSSSSGDAGDFQPSRGRWNQNAPANADETSTMPTSPGGGSFSNYWYAVYVEYETANYEMDLEVQWTSVDYDESNEVLAIYLQKGNNTHSLDATGGYMIIGDGTPDWGSTTGTISFWAKWDTISNRPWGQHTDMELRFSGSNLVLDWGATGSLTSGTSLMAGKWYFIAIVWDETTDDLYLYIGDQDTPPTQDAYNSVWTSTVSTVGVTQNNFMASRGGVDPTDGYGEALRYWDADRTVVDIQSDYNTELTGSETNLRSLFRLNNNFDDFGPDNNDGSGSGSYSFSSDVPYDAPPLENIRVDVWNGATWVNQFTDLATGWNNASVSSYLTSQTLTIRFKGGLETSDATRDSWNIDVVLLHVWSGEDICEVEFTGLSNTESWDQLNWTVNSAWTNSSINVTLQLYNYTLGGYPTSGSGYMAYTSDSIPNTEENRSQTITVNPTQFRNVTGYWKLKIRGVGDAQFDLNAEWIEFAAMNSGTRFTFKNISAPTVHLVSLWVNNATHHERYDLSIFLNAGDTKVYIREDIGFPETPYLVKVVTEKGNMAIYAES